MELTAIALWLNTAFAAFDENVAIAVHRLFEVAGGFFTPFMSFISVLGHDGIPLIIAGLIMLLFKKTRAFGTVLLAGIAIGALITNVIVKPLVARPRPYVWEGSTFERFWIELGCHTESDKSFPSGHMTAAMAASTAVFLRFDKKKSWTAFIFAFLMGISRIYLSVHYTTDVLGGIITGGLGGTLGYLVCKLIPNVWYQFTFRDLLNWIFRRGPAPFSKELASEEPAAAPARSRSGVYRGKHER